MKKIIFNICSFIFLGIIILISLIFSFLEIRALFALDFTLMNSAILGFMHYLSRGLYFLILASYSLISLIILLKNQKISFIYLIPGIALLFGSLFSLIFYHFYVAYAIIGLNVLLNLFNVLNLVLFNKK